MSRETAEWLNQMTLIGDTDKRGKAWHFDADYQEGTGNHFSGAIPMARIGELFAPFEPVSKALYVAEEDEDGNETDHLELDTFQAIGPVGRPGVYGIFKPSYSVHGYQEWLTENLSRLVDGEVHFSSAVLLQSGAVAAVELSLQETQAVDGITFLPHVLAFTSVNGKFATTFKRTATAVVCDNTFSAAARENTQTLKVKHSKYSRLKLQNARDALGLILSAADEFSAQVQEWLATPVTDKAFSKVLDTMVPVVGEAGVELSKAALTKAESKRETLTGMYRNDVRVSPWAGNAFGVVQLFNTYEQHVKPVRSSQGVQTIRAERNHLETVSGAQDKAEAEVLHALELALVSV